MLLRAMKDAMNHISIEELKNKAQLNRKTLINITHQTGGYYLAQALSGIDIMTAVFYRYLKSIPSQPVIGMDATVFSFL
ncbi:MAG: hypothetical protein ABH870_04280 [bacterium]